ARELGGSAAVAATPVDRLALGSSAAVESATPAADALAVSSTAAPAAGPAMLLPAPLSAASIAARIAAAISAALWNRDWTSLNARMMQSSITRGIVGKNACGDGITISSGHALMSGTRWVVSIMYISAPTE